MSAGVLGLGIVAPGARGCAAWARALRAAAPVDFKVLDLGDTADPKERRLPRLDRMALSAAREALGDHGTEGLGLVFGTGYGGLTATVDFLEGLAERGMAFGSPSAFHQSVHHAPAGQVSIALGIRGPCLTTSSRELSGESALQVGLGLLRTGRATKVLVVAADELTSTLEAGFRAFGSTWRAGEGAAAVLLGADPAAVGVEHCELTSHSTGTLRLIDDAAALTPALEVAARKAGERPLVSASGWGATEQAVLRQLVPSGQALTTADRLGANPSGGLLRLVAAALELSGGGPRAALLHGLSMGGGQATVVLRRR